MKTIELENAEIFTHCNQEDELVSSGNITGTYIVCEHIKCENFQAVICDASKEVLLIHRHEVDANNY